MSYSLRLLFHWSVSSTGNGDNTKLHHCRLGTIPIAKLERVHQNVRYSIGDGENSPWMALENNISAWCELIEIIEKESSQALGF